MSTTLDLSPPPMEAEIEEPLTLGEFAAMEFDDVVELVEGRVVYPENRRHCVGNHNPFHSKAVMRLGRRLDEYAEASGKWEGLAGDAGIRTRTDPDSVRGADIVLLTKEQFAKIGRDDGALKVVPELVIEVMSPSNTWDNVVQKMKEYFAIGVREVWIVSLAHREVFIHRSLTEIERFTAAANDRLTSLLLPDFELELADFFNFLPEPDSTAAR